MSRCIAFVAGLLTGAYISQTYKIPKVSVMVKTAITKLSEYEQKDSTSNDKNYDKKKN